MPRGSGPHVAQLHLLSSNSGRALVISLDFYCAKSHFLLFTQLLIQTCSLVSLVYPVHADKAMGSPVAFLNHQSSSSLHVNYGNILHPLAPGETDRASEKTRPSRASTSHQFGEETFGLYSAPGT